MPSVLTMKVGETYQLQISPSTYQTNTTWDVWTFQGNYITLSNTGLVTAVKEGMEIVFATLPNSSTPLTCTVYVRNPKLTLKLKKVKKSH